MNPHRLAVSLVLGCLLGAAAPAARASEPSGSRSAGPEAAGRAGADLAVAREAFSLRTNPAGLARHPRNRSDVSSVNAFGRIEFLAGPARDPYNGDQGFFTGNWAFAMKPSELPEDPLSAWPRREAETLEALGRRARYEGTLEVPAAGPPAKIEVLVQGTGFWVSELLLRARVQGDRVRRRFPVPGLAPLEEGQEVRECRAEFEYRLAGDPAAPAPSLTLSAYGQTAGVLLKGAPGEWLRGEVAISTGRTRLPPDASLTVVSEGLAVELRSLSFRRAFEQGAKRHEARTAVPDADLRAQEDRDGGEIVIASAPEGVRAGAEEKSAWALDDPGRFRGETITALVLEFRYGFEGPGAAGKLALLLDGKEVARRTLKPREEIDLADRETAERRARVEWLERDKVRLGIGVFTDGWLAAGYGDIPSDAGTHEGQIRYGLYALTVGAAVNLHPAVSIGASLDLYHGRFFNFDLTAQQPTAILGSFDATYRALTGRNRVSLQIDANDAYAWGAGGRVGVLLEPVKDVFLGLAFRTPGWIGRYGGKAGADFTDDFDATGFDSWLAAAGNLPRSGAEGYGSSYDLNLTGFGIPWRAGAGASWRIAEAVTLAADGEYVRWSDAADHLSLKFSRGSNPDAAAVAGSTFHARIPLRWKDQWIASLGLSADLHESFTLHLGYRYATSPAEGDAAHPLFPVHVQHTAALGFTARAHELSFHLAVQHGFQASLATRSSEHGPLFDGARFRLQEETLTVGVSYEY
ncbi:MAG: outer membrane protein transport protein [Planctomycetes bacterium]|nr:outer membrane protein transport protein [Planctomycetota bacterium]